jgi:hypothetical protein
MHPSLASLQPEILSNNVMQAAHHHRAAMLLIVQKLRCVVIWQGVSCLSTRILHASVLLLTLWLAVPLVSVVPPLVTVAPQRLVMPCCSLPPSCDHPQVASPGS